MRIALAQLNPLVGDVAGNTDGVLAAIEAGRAAGAALVVCPEQAIIGYPAKDLLLRDEIIDANLAALERIAQAARGVDVLVGFAERNPAPRGRPLFNSVAWLHDGAVGGVVRKRLLPTYDVFDEARYFEPARVQPVLTIHGVRVAVTICEDLLAEPVRGRSRYAQDPVGELAGVRPELILNLSASPYTLNKQAWRVALLGKIAAQCGAPLAYVNQVGGQDELIFDGASCVLNADGGVVHQSPSFVTDVRVVDTDGAGERTEAPRDSAALREALVLGLRDYARKCGFERAVVGVSGGIDSAVVAALGAEALGADAIHAIAMPSRFSSDHSVADARALAKNLGVQFSQVEIEPIHAAFESQLAPLFAGLDADVTEENIQARCRGVLLMAMSNKFGSLLLTTGNKSELAVGYCTLYGDMCGGLAVISDVPKTMVYRLARYLNETAGRTVIPQNTIDKPPSAELRPGQVDQDSLPPYEVLDEILERFETGLQSCDDIVAAGFERETVTRVLRLLRVNEYKRQQAAPGLKVTTRAFGFGRRMPIARR